MVFELPLGHDMNLLQLAIISGGLTIAIGIAPPAQATGYADSSDLRAGWNSSSYGDTTISASTGSNGTEAGRASSGGSSSTGTPIPEPSNIIMLALGVAGLVAGRFAARSKRAKRDKL